LNRDLRPRGARRNCARVILGSVVRFV